MLLAVQTETATCVNPVFEPKPNNGLKLFIVEGVLPTGPSINVSGTISSWDRCFPNFR